MNKNKDYSKSLLSGDGNNDYEKYIKSKILLSLQKNSEQWLDRDELLFQITHQSTELWLKLHNEELKEALNQLKDMKLSKVIALVTRALECIRLIIGQLEILTFMTPWDFLKIRPAFGNGSGMESPGWKNLGIQGRFLAEQFEQYIKENEIDLIQIYIHQAHSELYNLCEILVQWDDMISTWRVRHYKIAVRTLGHGSIGTKGDNLDKLSEKLNIKYFPRLWELRARLTEISTN